MKINLPNPPVAPGLNDVNPQNNPPENLVEALAWSLGQNMTPTPGYTINELWPLFLFIFIIGGIAAFIGVCSFCGRKGGSVESEEIQLVQQNVGGSKQEW